MAVRITWRGHTGTYDSRFTWADAVDIQRQHNESVAAFRGGVAQDDPDHVLTVLWLVLRRSDITITRDAIGDSEMDELVVEQVETPGKAPSRPAGRTKKNAPASSSPS